jgi:addiction module RelE/StbE family toxin
MKIVWSRRAMRHLTHVRDYIAKDSPKAAQEVATRILEAVERLADYPNLGRPGRKPGTRELVVPHTPYVIPYRVRGERVEVIAVFHGSQRWPDLL